MASLFKTKRFQPPLHLAVINDDLAAIGLLQNNPELVQRKNWLGFTPLELANLLGKEEIAKRLLPKIHPPILCYRKDQQGPLYCTRQEFEQLFGVHYLPGLSFTNNEQLEEMIKQCPLLLRYTVMGQEHRSLGSSLRRGLNDGLLAPVAIKWIDAFMGYGLFAEKAIKKEQFIGQYAGVVRKVHRLSPELNGYCIHLPTRFWSYNYFVIDAEKAGNELRFANHSSQPNMRPLCVIDRGLVHIAFFATREIEAQEELTFDYGKDYWQKRALR